MAIDNWPISDLSSPLIFRGMPREIFKIGNRPAATNGQQTQAVHWRSSGGFTLMEVMVAMAIMAIVLVSVYRMHTQTLTMNAAARFYTQAPLLAQSKLAQLETGSSEPISGDSGDFGEKFPGYSWTVVTEDVSSEVLGESGDLKRIDIKVSFNNDEYTYDFRTYRVLMK